MDVPSKDLPSADKVSKPLDSQPMPPSISLPDKPLFVIQAGKKLIGIDLRALWEYRELLYFLTWRDVKVRYKQTALGVAWAVIQPVFMMLIFTLFFGRLAGISSEVNIPYPLFAFAGLLPWTFFANAVTNSGNSLVGSANLITKVYFPRLVIPAASVGAFLVDFTVGFVILLGLMLYYGVALTWAILALPALIILVNLFALGVGMWLSAINVKYRDVRYAVPFLIQVWMFVSPVIYPVTMVPENWRWILALNPMTGIIEGFRASMFGQSFDFVVLGVSTLVTLLLLVYSTYSFRHMERSFADIV